MAHFAVVVSRFNELITSALREGAVDTLKAAGSVEVIEVPGTWEIPVVCAALVGRGSNRPDAIVALGCILQGETSHAALLAADVSSALMRLMVSANVPITWGVLTPETTEQALERTGLKHGNKGREAARAAIEMAEIIGRVRA